MPEKRASNGILALPPWGTRSKQRELLVETASNFEWRKAEIKRALLQSLSTMTLVEKKVLFITIAWALNNDGKMRSVPKVDDGSQTVSRAEQDEGVIKAGCHLMPLDKLKQTIGWSGSGDNHAAFLKAIRDLSASQIALTQHYFRDESEEADCSPKRTIQKERRDTYITMYQLFTVDTGTNTVEFSYNPVFLYELKRAPDIFSLIDTAVHVKLTSPSALSLYLLAKAFQTDGALPIIDDEVARDLFGLNHGMRGYQSFARMWRRLAEPAIAQINNVSDIRLTSTVVRRARTVAAYQVFVAPSVVLDAEQQGKKDAGRAQRMLDMLGEPSDLRSIQLLRSGGLSGRDLSMIDQALPYEEIVSVMAACEQQRQKAAVRNFKAYVRQALINQIQPGVSRSEWARPEGLSVSLAAIDALQRQDEASHVAKEEDRKSAKRRSDVSKQKESELIDLLETYKRHVASRTLDAMPVADRLVRMRTFVSARMKNRSPAIDGSRGWFVEKTVNALFRLVACRELADHIDASVQDALSWRNGRKAK